MGRQTVLLLADQSDRLEAYVRRCLAADTYRVVVRSLTGFPDLTAVNDCVAALGPDLILVPDKESVMPLCEHLRQHFDLPVSAVNVATPPRMLAGWADLAMERAVMAAQLRVSEAHEVMLRSALERSRMLQAVTSVLIAPMSPLQLLKDLSEGIAGILPADRVIFMLFADDLETVDYFVTGGSGFSVNSPLFPIDVLKQEVRGSVLRSRRPLLLPKGIGDEQIGAEARRVREDLGIGSVLIVPLIYYGQPLGALVAMNRADQRDFTDYEVDLVMAMANQAAVAVQTASLFEETQRLKAFNESIVEGVAEAIIIEDPTGTITFVNPAAAALLGDTREALVGLHHTAVIVYTPKGAPVPAGAEHGVSTSYFGKTHYEAEALSRAGRKIPVLVSVRPLYADTRSSDADALGAYCVGKVLALTDISEAKMNEQMLLRLSTAVRTTADAVIICDLDGDILDANEAALVLHGASNRLDLYGRNFFDLIALEDRHRAVGDAFQLIQEGAIVGREYELVTMDGASIPVEMSLSLMSLPGEAPLGFVAVGRDITERHQAELARQELEQKRERVLRMEHQSRELAMTLVEVAEILSSTLNRSELLDLILTQLSRVVAYDNATVMLLDGACLHLVAQHGLPPEIKDLPPLELDNFDHVREVIVGRHPVIIHDATQDLRWRQLSIVTETRCWLGVPLTVRDEVIGLLNLGKHEAGFYTTKHEQFALAFAQQAAIAIDNARLYEQARQDAEMKTRLLREVNHRVKNNLAAIIGLLYTEQHYFDSHSSDAVDAFIDRMVNRIQGLALVHSMLSDSGWEPLPLDHLAYQVISNALQMTPSPGAITVDILPDGAAAAADDETEPVLVNFKQAYDLAIVFNELATNTAKYALQGRDAARIEVEIGRDGPWIEICFRNDGPDYPDQVLDLDACNIGLHLVDTIVRHDMHGELRLKNDNGAVTHIRFKANAISPIAHLDTTATP